MSKSYAYEAGKIYCDRASEGNCFRSFGDFPRASLQLCDSEAKPPTRIEQIAKLRDQFRWHGLCEFLSEEVKAFHADRSSRQLPNLSAIANCDRDDGCLELGCTLGFSALACPTWAAIRSSSVTFRSHEAGMGRVASVFQLSCDRANDRSSYHRLARPVRLREVSSRRTSAGKPGESRGIAPQSSPSRPGRRKCEQRERSDRSRGVAYYSEDAEPFIVSANRSSCALFITITTAF